MLREEHTTSVPPFDRTNLGPCICLDHDAGTGTAQRRGFGLRLYVRIASAPPRRPTREPAPCPRRHCREGWEELLLPGAADSSRMIQSVGGGVSVFARFTMYSRLDKMNKVSFCPLPQFANRIAFIAIHPIGPVHRRVGSKWLIPPDVSALPPDFRSSADAQPELGQPRRDFCAPFNSA